MTEEISENINIVTNYRYTPPSRSPHYDVPDDPAEVEIEQVVLEVKTSDSHWICIDVTQESEDLSRALDWEHLLTNIQNTING